MTTVIKKIEENNERKNKEIIKYASEIIKKGGLVAFPTETVYGLGANALDKDAAKKIYTAKGRPSDNPLIAHISDMDMLKEMVTKINCNAEKLIEAFWPGPMTLIFNKKDIVPREVSGGLSTVAIRMPANNIALNLIKEVGLPIAAPSANKSGRPSPTSAQHVLEDLNSKIDMIIDGGGCLYGLESTIIDVTNEETQILRPGSITGEMISDVISSKVYNYAQAYVSKVPKAPGMKYRHYAPKAEMHLFIGNEDNIVKNIINLSKDEKRKFLIMATEETKSSYEGFKDVLVMGSRKTPESVGRSIFNILRLADSEGFEVIYTEGIEEIGIGIAIMNRLKKASDYNIIDATDA